MKKKWIRVSTLLFFMALLATLIPSCGNDEHESNPQPPTSGFSPFFIEVVKPDDAALPEWATVVVRITCTADISEHDYLNVVNDATVGVSFPALSNTANIELISTNLESYKLYAPGQKVGTDYGEGEEITATYPIFEAHLWRWKKDEQRYLILNVRPVKAGDFTLYVKAYGWVEAENTAWLVTFPDSGTMDQQNEYVQVHRFQVAAPIQ